MRKTRERISGNWAARLANRLWQACAGGSARAVADIFGEGCGRSGSPCAPLDVRRTSPIEALEARMLLAFGPEGAEFQVNTYTVGDQRNSSVAMDTAGDSVVSWNSSGQDGSGTGIYAQRYDAAGVAQGSEFRVNTYTAGDQRSPSVAIDAAGDFVVSWGSRYQDGSGTGIYAQRYDAAGVAQGSEFRVNTYTAGDQNRPSVAMDLAGDFVVSWNSSGQDGSGYGIYAQRYNTSGVAQGSEFRVNTYTPNNQYAPSVAMDLAGDFVVSWQSNGQDGSGYGIYAQRYNTSGVAQGSEFRVNTYTPNNQYAPSVAMDDAGDFVVSWSSNGQDGRGMGRGINSQRYNALGVAQGIEFRVNTYTTHTTNDQISPAVAMDAAGDFVVSWQSHYQGNSIWDIYAQRYNALGVTQGSEFQVSTSTYAGGAQVNPSLAMDAAGDCVVSWENIIGLYGSGSSAGIYARRFSTHLASVSGIAFNDVNGNGIRDLGELGLDGVLVGLYRSDNALIASTTTASGGVYQFAVRAQVAHYLKFDPPRGLLSPQDQGIDDTNDSDADPISGKTALFTLGADEVGQPRDAGVIPPVSVGDLVWSDLNGNGVRDAGEPGLNGVTVTLFTDTGTQVGSTTTANGGHYQFNTLLPGRAYYLQFTPPSFSLLTVQDQGSDDLLDSDADPITGKTAPFTIGIGQTDFSRDAGVVPPLSVGDLVWSDVNGNGVRDAGEPGLNGVTVTLFTDTGTQVGSTVSANGGHYGFDTLLPGRAYYLQFTPPPFSLLTVQDQGSDDLLDSDADPITGKTAPFTIGIGQTDFSRDAGVVPPLSVGDLVWSDVNGNGVRDAGEPGLDGVTVQLFTDTGAQVGSTTTTNGGHYQFDVGAGQAFYLQFIPTAGLLSPKDQGSDDLLDSDADPITGKTAPFTIGIGQSDFSRDAGIIPPVSVGDLVWNDLNNNGIRDAGEPGVNGVTVYLFTDTGTQVASTTTTNGGQYRFDTLLPGHAYYLQFSSPSWGFTAQDQGADDQLDSDANPATGTTAPFTIGIGQTDFSRDAGVVPPLSVGDLVWNDVNANGIRDIGEPGLDGVTVQLFSDKDALIATTGTGGGGLYQFNTLSPGQPYYLRFYPPLGLLSPQNQGSDDLLDSDADPITGKTALFTVGVGQTNFSIDAGVIPPVSVGDLVWSDINANGIHDNGEPGLAGVTVNLFTDTGSAIDNRVTADDGSYLFSSLIPGHAYYLQFIPSVGALTLRDQGTDDSLDSDADPVTGYTALFTVGIGQTDLSRDAGIIPPASVSGTVYFDANQDGLKQVSEVSLAGWIVFVDANANGVLDVGERQNTSGADGSYTLDNLPPGTQVIAQVAEDHWSSVAVRTVTLAIAQAATGVDLGNFTNVPSTAASPRGPEFRVNASIAGDQNQSSTASDAAGDFVVVWSSADPDGLNIRGQLYDTAGKTKGLEFRVNTLPVVNLWRPSVAMDSVGDFIVAWQNQDGDGYGIYAQRYSAAGATLGGEFRVNTATPGNQASPSVSMDSAGSSVVVWQSNYEGDGYGIYAQRYDAAGATIGAEFRVNTFTPGDQLRPSVSMNASGDSVVGWQGNGPDGNGVFAQRYNAVGTAAGTEFRVNTGGRISQNPSVAIDAAGDFVVVWGNYGNYHCCPSEVHARSFNPAGVPQGGELLVTRGGDLPDVAMDTAGDFVVTWQAYGRDGSGRGIFAQRYNAASIPQGSDFLVNTYTADQQGLPSIAMDSSGDFVIAWQSQNQDGEGYGIYAQRFVQSSQFETLAGRAFDDLNGNGIQDPGEPGRDGVRVTLTSIFGLLIQQAITSDGGKYQFDLIAGEEMLLQFEQTGGQVFTFPNVGADDAKDSDVPADGRLSLTLSAGQSMSNVDAGLVTPASLSGMVYLDANQDGVRNAREPSLAGWIVFVDTNGNAILDTGEPQSTSVSDGSYTLSPGGLFSGTLTIALVPQSTWTSAPARTVTLAVAEQATGIDFGNFADVPLTAESPLGGEFRVNTYIDNNQTSPSVAISAAGDFVVTWSSDGQDGSGTGIYAQRYNALGAAQGSEFRVNTYTPGSQLFPSVAMDAAGDFVVSWTSIDQDGSGLGIYAQRYNALGVAQGSEFRVNTYTPGNQVDASVAMDAAGNFVVSWWSDGQDGSGTGIYAQRYNALGVAQGSEFRVNTYTADNQFFPDVAMDAAGDFVVSWQSLGQDGSGYGVYAQRYNALGVAQGNEFRVNTYTADNQFFPDVAMDAAGDFVVSWQNLGQDGSGYGVYAQRYNALGVAQGSEFRVNTYTPGNQFSPSVTMDAAGDFVVSWHSYGQDGSGYGVYAQRYNPLGVAQGSEFLVNTYTTNRQFYPSVAMDTAGDFVVSWQSVGQDGSGYGIYAQRYTSGTIQLSASSGEDTILLRRNGNKLEVFRQNPPVGTPAISQPVDAAPSLTLDLLGGDDQIIIDFTGGNPIPPGGLFLDAGGGVNTLSFVGPVSGNINITGGTMDIIADPNGGALVLSETAAVRFTASAHLASLSLTDNAKITFAAPAQFLRTTGLSISGNATLDLGDDSLIVDATAQNRAALLAALGGLLRDGRNGGSWSGKGITSSSAASDPNHLTTLAALLNDRGDGTPLYTNFAGQPVDGNSVLIKYTYNGDTDLSGKLDADDYFQIDSGFVSKRTGYRNGDFDFNGVIDADDYFLLDLAFARQSGVLASSPPATPLKAQNATSSKDRSRREQDVSRRNIHHRRPNGRSRVPSQK